MAHTEASAGHIKERVKLHKPVPQVAVLHKYVKRSPPDGQANNIIKHIQYQASTRREDGRGEVGEREERRWREWIREGEGGDRKEEEEGEGGGNGVGKRDERLQELTSQGKYSGPTALVMT